MIAALLGVFFAAHAQLATTPENCLAQKTFPCAVSTSEKATIAVGGNGYYLSKATIIEFSAKQEARLVKGHLWGRVKKNLRVTTAYGFFVIDGSDTEAEFWVDSETDGFVFKVIAGFGEIHPKGSGEPIGVARGQQAKLSTVNYKMKSCFVSNPTAIDLKEHARMYSRVFPFGLLSVDEHMEKMAAAVLSASSRESFFLRTSVTRQLASAIEREHRMKVQAEEDRQLQDHLKKLFKIKSNFEDQ